MKLRFLFIPLLLLGMGCAPKPVDWPRGHVIDLTHDFDESTIYWPTEAGFQLKTEKHGLTDKGYWYESNAFAAPEHGGTHIDAPIHFYQEGRTVAEIPLEQLIGPAIVVDVSESARQNRDYQVRVADLENWEKRNGRIPDGAIVLLRTGYGRFWPDRSKYLGTDERGEGAVAKLHFPGLSPEAAQWLVSERGIKAVGLDTASIDYGQSADFKTHRFLFEHNVPAFENVANLDELPLQHFYVIALPMKIAAGSGAPLRIMAIIP